MMLNKKRIWATILTVLMAFQVALPATSFVGAFAEGDTSDGYSPFSMHRTVEFHDYLGNRLVDPQSVLLGSPAYPPQPPQRPSVNGTAYEFDGWESTPAGISISAITEDVVFTATYRELNMTTFTVEYKSTDPNVKLPPKAVENHIIGETINVSIVSPAVQGFRPDQETVTYSGEITRPMTVEVYYTPEGNVGYNVLYWVELSGNVGDPVPNYQNPGAPFEPYVAPGGSAPAQEGGTAEYGSLVNLDQHTKSIPGYTAISQVVQPISGATTYNIFYKRNINTLMFDGNGDGASYTATVSQKYGDSVTLETPSRLGYTFAGWSLNRDGSGTRYQGTMAMPAESATLYAQWQPQNTRYKIIYWIEKPYMPTDFVPTPGNMNDFVMLSEGTQLVNATTGQVVEFTTATAAFQYLPSSFKQVTNRVTASNGRPYGSFIASDKVTIKGDGSSVVNVYFRRDILTLTFNAPSGTKIVTGGQTLTSNTWQLKTKFEQDISGVWPEFTPNYYSWSPPSAVNSSSWVSKRGNMSKEMLPTSSQNNAYSLSGSPSENSTRTVTYYFEALPNQQAISGYPAVPSGGRTYFKDGQGAYPYTQTLAVGSSGLSPKDIMGFTAVTTGSSLNLYYRRNTHTLSFDLNVGDEQTGLTKPANKTVMFDEPISSHAPAGWVAGTGPRWTGTDGMVRTFGGWSRNAEGTQPVDFSTYKMLDASLTVYAIWNIEEVSITFMVPSDMPQPGLHGTGVAPKGGVMGDAYNAIAMPIRDGYVFLGWYDGDELFTPGTQVNDDITVYARYEASPTTYHVQYHYLNENNQVVKVRPDKLVYGRRVSNTIIMGNGTDADPVFYDPIPTVAGYMYSHIEPQANNFVLTPVAANNVITVWYNLFTGYQYRVHYLVQGTNEKVFPSVDETEVFSTEAVQKLLWAKTDPDYRYKAIEGFKSTTLNLNEVTDITFYYEPYKDVDFVEQAILLGGENDGHIVESFNRKDRIGQTVRTTNLAETYQYLGDTYRYLPSAPNVEIAIIQNENSQIVLKRYYQREHTLTFVAGANGSLTGATTDTVPYNTDWSGVTVPTPVPDEGYYFSHWAPEFPQKVLENDTYEAVFPKRIDISMNASLSPSAPNYTYNGQVQFPNAADVVITITSGALKPGHKIVAETQGEGVNAGTHPFTLVNLRVVDTANGDEDVSRMYYLTAAPGTYEILKRDITVTADYQSRVYRTNNPELTYEISNHVSAEEGTIRTALGEAFVTNAVYESLPAEYDITKNGQTPNELANYFISFTGNKLLVTAYDGGEDDIVVKAEDKTVTYGDPLPTFTSKTTGTPNGEQVVVESNNYALDRAYGDAGDYTIRIANQETVRNNNAGYVIARFDTGNLKVNPYDGGPDNPVTVTPDNKTITYGDPLPTFTSKTTNSLNNEQIVVEDDNYQLDRAYTSAGTYTISIKNEQTVRDNNGNYVIGVFGTGTLTVLPYSNNVTVKVDDKTITYGDPMPTYTAKTTGALGNEQLAVASDNYQLDRAYAGQGIYTISIVDEQAVRDNNANYVISSILPGTLTVLPYDGGSTPVTVTVNNETVTYGDPLPTFTSTTAGTLNNDQIVVGSDNYELDRAYGDAGTYTVSVKDQAAVRNDPANKNYTIDRFIPGTLTVLPYPGPNEENPVTVTVNDETITYGDPLPTYTSATSNSLNNEQIVVDSTNYVLVPVYNGRGTYTIKIADQAAVKNDSRNKNYIIGEFVDGTLTVLPYAGPDENTPVTVKVDDKTITYGDTLPTYTSTTSNSLNNEQIAVDSTNYQLDRAYEGAGTYTISIIDQDAVKNDVRNKNYEIGLFEDGTLTVLPYAGPDENTPVKVKVDDKTITFGNPLPTYTATTWDSLYGEQIIVESDNYKLDRAYEGVGTYTISIIDQDAVKNDIRNKNYEIGLFEDGTLTVLPFSGEVTVTVDDKTITYGDPLPTYTSTTTGALGTDQIVVASDNYKLNPAYNKAGTYTISIVDKDAVRNDPANKDYTITSFVDGTLTVLPYAGPNTENPVTVKVDNKTITYGDPLPTYTSSTSNSLYGEQIVVESANYQLDRAYEGQGTYTISITDKDAVKDDIRNKDYIIGEFVDGTLTVLPYAGPNPSSPVTVTADDKTITYGDPLPTYTSSTSNSLYGEQIMVDSANYVLDPAYNKAGTYTIKIADQDAVKNDIRNKNYEIGEFVDGTLTVLPYAGPNPSEPVTVTVDDKTITYGDPLPTYTSSTSNSLDNEQIVVEDSNYVLVPGYNKAGTYTIKIADQTEVKNDVRNKDYTIGQFVDGTLTVLPYAGPDTENPVTVTVNDETITYGDPLPTYTSATSNSLYGEQIAVDSANYVLVPVYNGQGTYTIKIADQAAVKNDSRNKNYIIGEFVDGTLTVLPYAGPDENTPVTVTVDNKTITYGDTLPTYTSTTSNSLNNEQIAVDSTNYQLDRAYEGAGTYTISIIDQDAVKNDVRNKDYTIGLFVDGTLTVLPYGGPNPSEPVTVTVDNKTITFGNPLPTYTATTSNSLNNEQIIVESDNYKLDRAYEGVGTYTISIIDENAVKNDPRNKNYEIGSFVDGTLTVNPFDGNVVVKVDDKTITYGDPLPTYTSTTEGALGNDKIEVESANYQLDRAYAGQGTYTISIIDEDAVRNDSRNKDYTITEFIDGTLTVNAYAGPNPENPVTVTVDDKTITYGDPLPTYTSSTSNSLNNEQIMVDSANYVLDPVYNKAGTYTIKIADKDAVKNDIRNKDYIIGLFVDGTLTVLPYAGPNPSELVTVTVDDKTITYGDTLPTYTSTTSNSLYGEQIMVDSANYQLDRAYAGQGTYTISITDEDAVRNDVRNKNYTINQFVDGTLTVLPYAGPNPSEPVTVTVDDKTITYGDPLPTYTSSTSNSLGNEQIVVDDANYHLVPVYNGRGTYTIKITDQDAVKNDVRNKDYTIGLFEDGTLTVLPYAGPDENTPVTVTVDDKTITYGEPLPTYTSTTSNSVNSEQIEVDSTNYKLDRAYEGQGTYTISIIDQDAVKNDVRNKDYTIGLFVDGTLTVLPYAGPNPNEPVTVTVDNKTMTHGNPQPTYTATTSNSLNNEQIIIESDNYELDRPYEGVGTYTISIIDENAVKNDPRNKNYEIGSFVDGTLTVNPFDGRVVVRVDNKTITYGDPLPTYTSSTEGALGNDKIVVASDNYELNPLYNKAGTYTISIVDEDAVHNDPANKDYTITEFIDGTLTVNAYAGPNPENPVTVTVDNKTITYGEPLPTYTSSTTNSLNNEQIMVDSANYQLDREYEGQGTYTISITDKNAVKNDIRNKDYIIGLFVDGTLTVLPYAGPNPNSPVTVTVDDKTITYGDPLPTYTSSTSNSLDNEQIAVDDSNYVLDPAYNKAGIYTIKIADQNAVKSDVRNKNYEIGEFVDGTLTVRPYAGPNPANPVTVTVEDKTITYGEPLPTYTSTTSNSLYGEQIAVDSANYVLDPAYNKAGTYTIKIADQDAVKNDIRNKNYEIGEFVDGTLTVLPYAGPNPSEPVTVTVNNETITYGDPLPTYTSTTSNSLGNEQIMVDSTNYVLVPVYNGRGTYTIKIADQAAVKNDIRNKDYTIGLFVDGTLTVLPYAGPNPNEPVTVTVDNKTMTHGNPQPTYTATTSNSLNNEQIIIESDNYELDRPYEGVGTYTISIIDENAVKNDPRNKNYVIGSFVDGTLTVNPFDGRVVVRVDNKTITYGDPLPTYTSSTEGALGNDKIVVASDNYELNPVYNKAGTYTISIVDEDAVHNDPANKDYTITEFIDGTLIVNAYAGPNPENPVTVTVDNKTITYGDPLPTYTSTTTNTLNNERIEVDSTNYQLDRVYAGQGTYTISITDKNAVMRDVRNKNYLIGKFVDGTLTVLPYAGPNPNNPVTVTVDDKTITYGDPLPTYTSTTSNSLDNEQIMVDSANYVLVPVYNGRGTYTIKIANQNAVKSDVRNKNYTIGQFVDGTLTVLPYAGPNPANPVTVTASSHTITYGEQVPTLKATTTNSVGNEQIRVAANNYVLIDTSDNITELDPANYRGLNYIPMGTYRVKIKDEAAVMADTYNKNYTIGQFVEGILEVEPAAGVNVWVQNEEVMFGAPEPSYRSVTTGTLNDLQFVGITHGLDRTYGNAGDYVISITNQQAIRDAYPDYTINRFVPGKLTVKPYDDPNNPVTITVNNERITYGDPLPTFSAVTTNALNNAQMVGMKYIIKPNYAGNAGTYQIHVSNEAEVKSLNPNYVIRSFVPGTLIVDPYAGTLQNPVKLKADDKVMTYGDPMPAYTGTTSGTLRNEQLVGARYMIIPGYHGAGTYTIRVSNQAQVRSLNPNYVIGAFEDGILTVNPLAGVVVKADDKAMTYGDPMPTYTSTIRGTINGETIVGMQYALDRPYNGAGTYTISISNQAAVRGLLANKNYSIDRFETGILTVEALGGVEVEVEDKVITYGDALPNYTAVSHGTLDGDEIVGMNYALDRTYDGAGTYTIHVTNEDAVRAMPENKNYKIDRFIPGTLTVLPYQGVVLQVNEYTITYGDDLPVYEATVTGTLNDEQIVGYNLALVENYDGVGEYTIGVANEAEMRSLNKNYVIEIINGKLTVNPLAGVLVTVEDKTITFGDLLPEFTAITTGTAYDEVITGMTYVLDRPYDSVGQYTIMVANEDDVKAMHKNYIIEEFIPGTLTVEPKLLSPAAVHANGGILYNDPVPGFPDYIIDVAGLAEQVYPELMIGFDPSDLTISTTYVQGDAVGTYPILVEEGLYGNYRVEAGQIGELIVRGQVTVDPNYPDDVRATPGERQLLPVALKLGESTELPSNNDLSFVSWDYRFAGWSTTPDGSVEYTNQGALTMGETSVTLYAQWVALPSSFTVTVFHLLDGTDEQIGAPSVFEVGRDQSFTITPLQTSRYIPVSDEVITGTVVDKDLTYVIYYTARTTPGGMLPDEFDPDNPDVEDAREREELSLFTLLDDDIPLSGIAARNMGDCAK